MDAVDYLKTRERMCGELRGCSGCPLAEDGVLGCDAIESQNPEKAVEAVEMWGKNNPTETYLNDFLKKFPNAILNDRGYPNDCVRYLYGHDCAPAADADCGGVTCVECWNRQIKQTTKCRFYAEGRCLGTKWAEPTKCGGDKKHCER